jgi:hypothetical protein
MAVWCVSETVAETLLNIFAAVSMRVKTISRGSAAAKETPIARMLRKTVGRYPILLLAEVTLWKVRMGTPF